MSKYPYSKARKENAVMQTQSRKIDFSLQAIVKVFVGVIGVGIGIFHLYTGEFGVFEAYFQRFVHLLTLMIVVFLHYPFSKKISKNANLALGIVPALLTIVTQVYLFENYERIVSREWYYGEMLSGDFLFGILLIILVLDSTRRVVGLALPIIAVSFIVYTFVGENLPYPFTIISPSIRVFIDHMFLTTQAIFGVPVGVSATFIYLFIMFGAFLESTKGGQFILDLSMALVGRTTGGPAKVAVIASALFGTVSGHSVANVYATGTFTIPLMKRAGYKPAYAGAVEAAASSGGQIMPPVMGAAAFVMAEILGVSYLSICKAAIMPALLYFLAIFASTHIEALKGNYGKVRAENTETIGKILKRGFHFLIPITVLVVVLIEGYTPFRAAFIAIIVLIVVAEIFPHTRFGLKGFYEGFMLSAKNGAVIAVSCACAGIIVGVLDVTGIGIRFVSIVTQLSMGIYPLALILVMLSCLVLGMGIPTTPAYIIAAMIGGPILIQLGAEPIAAQMFVFYASLLSAITPPVAMAAYAGASIAGAGFMETGFIACKLGFVKIILPFIFAYNTTLLMVGPIHIIIYNFITAVIGTLTITLGMEGYLFAPIRPLYRPLYILAGALAVIPGVFTDIIGFVIASVLIVLNYRKSRAPKSSLERVNA
jgi:TRAP transporter 4TM/12TM fusion protein